MKLLSITVPCYNSQDYMENCINSLLTGGEEVEILIVDDGSADKTGEIADRLAKEHPTIIRAIHQQNKGHGGAVNTGIANATGLYFKVVDSDDKVKAGAYKSILNTLREFAPAAQAAEDAAAAAESGVQTAGTGTDMPEKTEQSYEDADETDVLDLLISNFVYNKEGMNRHKVMQYRRALPKETLFSWEATHHFKKGQYILMHSVIYRTQLLRDCGLRLPEHTFYVDNIYVFNPMPYVKNMYYLDVNFYYYFIGREDQSVNQKVMTKRLDQQARVNELMIDYYTDPKIRELICADGHLHKYMYNYLEIITTVTSTLAICSGEEDKLAIKKEVWEHLKERDAALYFRMRRGVFGIAMYLPGKPGQLLVKGGYKLADRIYSFS